MLKVILIFLGCYLLTLIDIFFSALTPPLNLFQIFNLVLVVIFLYQSTEFSLISALTLGLIVDVLHNDVLGISMIIYITGFIVLYLIRNSILTSESRFSIFLTIVIFNTYYFLINSVWHFKYNWLIGQQLIISLLLNSILAIMGYFIIERLIKKYRSKFL